VPAILQYLLVLTYIALIFSVSATISSLVLTRNFGNVPFLAERLQEKIGGMPMPTFESSLPRTRSSDDIAPRRWRLLECHCTYGEFAGPVTEPLTYLMARVVHAGRIRAVSPGTDSPVYLDARERSHQSHHLRGGRVFGAPLTTFLAHLLEERGGPKEAHRAPFPL
jgi:hypothetical protein